MGYCDKSDYTLAATVMNLVMQYKLLWQIRLCAMGHCGEFGYVLWATAQNEAIKIFENFHAMGENAGFSYALWAIAMDLVICYGP
jgi:hypothetical protein